MGVPFAGVCAALSAVMAATIVVAAEAPEGPYRESIMLVLCVAFHGGMALLIHGVQRGVPPQPGYPGKVAAAETGSVYDNSGMFTHESGMTAGEAVPLAEQVRKLKDQLEGSVYIRVFADKAVAALGREKVAGAFTERVRPSLPFVGLAATSLAVTGLSASLTTPAVAFALFALLLGGLSLVTTGVSQLG